MNNKRQAFQAAGRQLFQTARNGVRRFDNKIGHKLLEDSRMALGEADKFDQSMSKIMNYWRFRIDRMFTPNFVNHMHGICALILNMLQLLIILHTIYSTHGHLGKITNVHEILLPTYLHIVLRLFIQMTVLVFVIFRAFHVEPGHIMLSHFKELSRFKPVIEQLIPIFTYSLMLCTAIAVGSCHINPSQGVNSGLCSTFNLTTVKAFIGVYAAIQVCHHLISIYHSYRNSTIPEKKTHSIELGRGNTINLENSYATKYPENTNFMEPLEHIDEDMGLAWKWWEQRMNKVFGSSVSHHVCKMFDVILEAVMVSLLISAAHNSYGNLQNLKSIGAIFIPMYVKFFGKALIQFIAFVYYYQQMCNDSRLFEFLVEPNKWIKPLEHALPVVTYTVMGVTALSIGYCHLDISDQSFALCKAFPHNVVNAVVIIVGLCQLIHHTIAINRHHVYAAKHQRKVTQYEDIPMSETTSHYGQLE